MCTSLTCYVEQVLRLGWNVWICHAVVFFLPFAEEVSEFSQKPGSCLSLQFMRSASRLCFGTHTAVCPLRRSDNPALEQNISYHLYANDILLYCSFKASKIHRLSSVINCLTSMKQWLSDNYLQLNPDNTESLIITPDSAISEIKQHIGALGSCVKWSHRNIGVIFDRAVPLEHHSQQ